MTCFFTIYQKRVSEVSENLLPNFWSALVSLFFWSLFTLYCLSIRTWCMHRFRFDLQMLNYSVCFLWENQKAVFNNQACAAEAAVHGSTGVTFDCMSFPAGRHGNKRKCELGITATVFRYQSLSSQRIPVRLIVLWALWGTKEHSTEMITEVWKNVQFPYRCYITGKKTASHLKDLTVADEKRQKDKVEPKDHY